MTCGIAFEAGRYGSSAGKHGPEIDPMMVSFDNVHGWMLRRALNQ
jgi:hypothetical protein